MLTDLLQYQGLVDPPVQPPQIPSVVSDYRDDGQGLLAETQVAFVYVEPPAAEVIIPTVVEWGQFEEQQADPGWGAIEVTEATYVPPAPAPDFIQGVNLDPVLEALTTDYLTAGATPPIVDDTFPTTLDDLLGILRRLAYELQPNAQNEWEKRRNWQKLVEALSRI